MPTISIRLSLVCTGLLAGTAVGAACSNYVENDEHCIYHEGNDTCRERYGNELRYCGTVCLGRDGNEASPNGDGCVATRPEDGCYSPCGGNKDITEDDSCVGVADTGSTDVSVGTEPTGTTLTTEATEGPSTTVNTMSGSETEPTTGGPVGCTASSECTDANAPLCLNELCVPCTDSDTPNSSCAEKDAGLGVCGNDGACVECTSSSAEACMGETPVCDEETSACIGCAAHDDCGDSACAFETGECLDACLLEVDGDGGADATTVQAAVGMVADGEDCTIVVHELDGNEYGTVVIDGGKRIALLAASGEEPVIQGSGIEPGIELSEGAQLYADGLQLRLSGTGPGLIVKEVATVAYVDRCEVAQNSGGGITVSDGAELHLRNATVGGSLDVPALLVSDATAEVVYSTVLGSAGESAALACSGTATVDARNSILASRADAADDIDCEDATISYTATEVAVPGSGNVSIGVMGAAETTAWFEGYATGNFSLLAAGATIFADIAQWQSGDPPTDIDGDLRPDRDGAADYAGADIP
jgi:hypothetical protein